IRYVLQKVQTFPRSPVIFCDEVQDFTRIELDLIWQLSSFTKYDLTGQTNIPFAFAGDPNQTVHPTGFQWNNLIELFTERFKKLNLNDLGLKSKQLFHNYRSKSAIIKFSNLIQKFRFAFLDIAELRPQVSWQKKEGISPSLFILQEDLEIDDLENILQQAMVLIPTSRNEEEYIRKNKFLKEIILPPEKKKKKGKRAKKKRQVLQRTSLNNSTEITENQPKKPSLACKIMSVASAKGLEFDKVVLYNFGDHIPDSFQKSIGGEPLNDNEKIELIHFFSKLYVAVSRASDYLFIIDTQKGFANFWTYFMEQNLISFEQNEYWKESDIVPLSKGEKADLDNITEDNPQKIAETLQESGKTKKNYELLLRAQQYYQSIHQKDQALDCAAWAHWYREDWAKAGKLFTQLQNLPKAAESFWKAKKWQSIKNLPPPIEEKCPYLPYAKYMLKEGDFLQILKKICSNKQLSPNSETWKVIVKQLQKDFKKTIICKDNKTFKDYAFFAEKIGERGFKDFFDIAGDFYFRDKQYSLAIESWDENHNLYEEESFTITRPHYRPSDYFNAQLEITDDDNTDRKVFWLHQLKEYEELVELYEKAEEEEPSKKLNDSTYSFIFNAFVHLKKFDKALAYPHISIQKKAQKFLEKNRLRKLGLQSKESERREQLFNLLLESGFEGGEVLITHIEDFKACFEKKSVGKKISKNKHWKGIFEAYKNLKKGSVFATRLGDFAYYLKDQNWVKNCKNTVLKDQFEYILPFFTDTQYNIKNREEKIELLFKTLVNHTIGINLIHRHIESFDSIFTNEKMLGEVLDKSNWSELLKEFEGNFREGFSSRYPETFIDLVCQQLSKNKTAQLTHTLELMNELTEADKLIQYVKLINSVPKPPTSVSTENLSETLKDHLCKIVT
ncbi:MAG: 3'-5' exonuclease, partial [Chitinophagales bacterium]